MDVGFDNVRKTANFRWEVCRYGDLLIPRADRPRSVCRHADSGSNVKMRIPYPINEQVPIRSIARAGALLYTRNEEISL